MWFGQRRDAGHVRRLEQLHDEWIPCRVVRTALTPAQATAQVTEAMAEARQHPPAHASERANASACLARKRFATELEAVARPG